MAPILNSYLNSKLVEEQETQKAKLASQIKEEVLQKNSFHIDASSIIFKKYNLNLSNYNYQKTSYKYFGKSKLEQQVSQYIQVYDHDSNLQRTYVYDKDKIEKHMVKYLTENIKDQHSLDDLTIQNTEDNGFAEDIKFVKKYAQNQDLHYDSSFINKLGEIFISASSATNDQGMKYLTNNAWKHYEDDYAKEDKPVFFFRKYQWISRYKQGFGYFF
ncbi:hypothetical protein [Mesoplasma seiffertii]|uniref:hypothetical protein n=1 Tax=Mesoplasma seiffertii TaxID=28224 RepID=UPI00047D254D|nr:hypothetical protein [Mesoplasma seiffertii]